MAFTYPVAAPVGQPFGANPAAHQPQGHYGVDLPCATGTDVRAIGDGVVRWADWGQNMGSNPWMMIPGSPNSGINVIIDHGAYVSVYAHLDSTPMNVGDRVTGGSIIGKSGNTGLSTGPHLHLELIYMPNINGFMYGRVDPIKLMSSFVVPGNFTPAANQRVVGPANLNQRSEPKSSATVVRVVPANTLETFIGYVRGEEVNLGGVKTNIWYKDTKGYVWAGGFNSQSTTGLNDETPAPALLPAQRRVGAANINQRLAAVSTAKIVRIIQANTVETFTGFVRGQKVSLGGVTSDVWFRDSAGYAWAGGFTSQATTGLPDQTPNPLIRKVIPTTAANLRERPSGDSKIIATLEPGHQMSITGYVLAERVGDSDVWFHRKPEGYIHASTVTDASLDGLSIEKTPAEPVAPVAPNPLPDFATKKLIDFGVNLRKAPASGDNVIGQLDAGANVSIGGYTDAGEAVEGSTVWFQIAPGTGWIHGSTVIDPSLGSIPKIKVAVVSPSVPTDGTVVEEPYAFTPDFDFVEYKPANTWNMQNGNFPSDQDIVVLHQFDAKDLKPSIDGVISHFQNPRPEKPSSAHFVVSGKRIVQMVSLKDRAYHAGTVGNDYIGIEVDPQEDADTVASVKKLIAALNKRYNKVLKYSKHRDVPGNSTLCGADIHLEKYRIDTPVVAPPVVTPPVVVPPVVVPPAPAPRVPTKEEIDFVLNYLKTLVK